jgi:conjugal transfer pilus assembly protein TrbC
MRHANVLLITILTWAMPLVAGAGAEEEAAWKARIDAAVKAADQADAQAWAKRNDKAVKAVRAAEAAPAPGANCGSWSNIPQPSAVAPSIAPLAEGFQAHLVEQAQGAAAPGGLTVFVSLSMPKASLEALVAEAERTGATLVLRGMRERSLTKTAEAVQRLIGARQVAWTIDPDAFRRFRVESVPVFVLTRAGARPKACGEDVCLADEDYARIAGDMSIAYALDTIERLLPAYREDAARARGGW